MFHVKPLESISKLDKQQTLQAFFMSLSTKEVY